MKTYEEFESPSYVYRLIGRAAYGSGLPEVHHVRRNKHRHTQQWGDVPPGLYDRLRIKYRSSVVRKSAEPDVLPTKPTLEIFEGNNGRVYRKLRGYVRGKVHFKYQSRPLGQGPVRWVTIGKQRYDTMKWVTIGQTYGGTLQASPDQATSSLCGIPDEQTVETPQGRAIRRGTLRLEEMVFAANERAQFDRDAYGDLSNKVTKIETERDMLEAEQATTFERLGEVEQNLNLVRTQRDNLQVKLNHQLHRIKNAEYAQHQAEERLGEVARECSDLKQDVKSLRGLLENSELGRLHAEDRVVKGEQAVNKANARWETFVDKVVNPPMSEAALRLQARNAELREVIDGQAEQIGILQSTNKKLLRWKDRAHELRRLLKIEREVGRLLTWAQVDKRIKDRGETK